jgi:hypothetical protein
MCAAPHPGGHFIATFPDAHRVMWHTKDGGIHNSRMLRIAKEWEVGGQTPTHTPLGLLLAKPCTRATHHHLQSPEHIPVTPFGNRYFFAISDTVTAGAGEKLHEAIWQPCLMHTTVLCSG